MSTQSIITTCQGWYRKCAHYFYLTFLKPKSLIEDNNRSERILTLILFSILLITVIFELSIIFLYLTSRETYDGIPILKFTVILILFLGLYILTRRGYFKITSYAFIFILFISIFYTSFTWGASLPMGLLAYGLVVTTASIVINSRFGFIVAILSCLSIIGIGIHEHSTGTIPSWKQNTIQIRDVYGYGIMIGLTALLSRLSNREMEKSLARARSSEAALKAERDNLEIIAEARTKALRESERERIRELYRFAEFGKLSGGIFHDLLNPLTAVSLSIEQLSKGGHLTNTNTEAAQSIQTAVQATKKMEQFMATVRKQIKSEDMQTQFSLNAETEDAIELIAFRAKKAGVAVHFSADENIEYFGNPLKYNQVITNLIINGIDACATSSNANLQRTITVTLHSTDDNILCSVADNGTGISPDVLEKIFTPFFTTKEKGIGLGLSTTKDIIENHLHGTITCSSNLGTGTTFTISLPKQHNANKQNPAQENSEEYSKGISFS